MSNTKQYNNVQAILWMLSNSLATTILYCIGKYISKDLNPLQVVFLYKLVVLMGIAPWIYFKNPEFVKTKRIFLHLARGFFSTAGSLLFFYGLYKVEIANAIALSKIEPIFLMIIGMLYFKESINFAKILSFIISFVGMIFVIHTMVTYENNQISFPILSQNLGFESFNYNYLFILVAMLAWSINSSLVKLLGKTESNQTQLFYVSIISVFLTMPAALFEWNFTENGLNLTSGFNIQNIGVKSFYLILLMGLLYFIHASCNFLAFKIGEMSVVVPFDYSKLVFGGMLDYFFFQSVPSFSSCVGYILICCSGIYLLKIQSMEKKRKIKEQFSVS